MTTTAILNGLASESALTTMVTFVAVIIMVLAKVGDVHHERLWPCDRCAARFPLNAPALAERRRAILQRYHNKWLAAAVLGPMLMVLFAGPWVLRWTLGAEGVRSYSSLWLIPMWPILAYFAWERHVHRKLQPWCPWCRRRDEDDDPIVIPEPTPPSAQVDA